MITYNFTIILDSLSAKLDSAKQTTQSALQSTVDTTKSAAESAANKTSQVFADSKGLI